jgi:hypothetical protein
VKVVGIKQLKAKLSEYLRLAIGFKFTWSF